MTQEQQDLIIEIVDEKLSSYREGEWYKNLSCIEYREAKMELLKLFKTK